MAAAVDLVEELAGVVERILAPPPPPRRLLDFARSLFIAEAGTGQVVPYDPATHVAQLEILRAFADGGHYEMVTLGPIQDGKTTATLYVPMLYALAELRQPTLYAGPTRDLLDELYLTKLRPMIETSGLAWLLPSKGLGSSGASSGLIQMTTGAPLFLRSAGGRTEAGQAAITVRFVFVDERDDVASRTVELFFGRAEAYGPAARRGSTSTLKLDGQSSTQQAYDLSTGSRLAFACPRCRAGGHASGGWQLLEWSRVTYVADSDTTAEESVRLVCQHNAEHRLTEDERIAMVTGEHRLVHRGQTVAGDGTVVGPAPATRVWGLRWTSLESRLKDMRVLATKHRQAMVRREQFGDHGAMRQFWRDHLVAPYRDEVEALEGSQQISREYLASRSQTYGWATSAPDKDELGLYSRHVTPLPPGAELCTLTVDVQDNRCYWLLVAADLELRTWDVAWGYEFATAEQTPTSEGELHRILDRIRDLEAQLLDGADLVVAGRAVDVGYRQDDIVPWLKGNPGWLPIAGAGEDVLGTLRKAKGSGSLPGVIYRYKPDGWRLPSTQRLHFVEADRVKEQAQNAFLRPVGAAGAAHLPRGLKANDSYIRHLCGERLEVSERTGKRRWRQQAGRHDFLDCRTYAHALLRLHIEHHAGGSDAPPNQPAPPPPPPPPPGDWSGGVW